MFEPFVTHFATGASIQEALNEYNTIENKSCKAIVSTGHNKKYVCSDTSDENNKCKFELQVYRKLPTKGTRVTRVSHIQEGHWYVTKFQCHSSKCTVTMKPSAKQLGSLPAFINAVQGWAANTNTANTGTMKNNSSIGIASESVLKKVISETHSVIGLSHAKIQRARDIVRKQLENEANESYGNIPNLCSEIITNNPGSRLCCQLDSDKRFYRLFMILKSSIDLVSNSVCIPCLELYATAMKHCTYNGICLTILSKTADDKNVPIAIGMIPSESIDNYIWFFLNLKTTGIPLDTMILFTDRGKQMNAYKRLQLYGCTGFHIKNCTYNIAKTICTKYSTPSTTIELQSMIYQLQNSVSMNNYIRILVDITKKFNNNNTRHRGTSTTTATSTTSECIKDKVYGTIMDYIMELHPTQFSIVGNLNISKEEKDMLSFIWGNESYGDPKPMFGIRSTTTSTATTSSTNNNNNNSALIEDDENNVNLHNTLRHQTIAQAMMTFITQCSKVRGQLENYYNGLVQRKCTICEKATTIINAERAKSTHYTVLKCNATLEQYNVISNSTAGAGAVVGKSTLVDLDNKTCSSCLVRNQLVLPCCHIIAVLAEIRQDKQQNNNNQQQQNKKYQIMDYILPSYQVKHISDHINKACFTLPTSHQMLPRIQPIKPPPRYNEYGQETIIETTTTTTTTAIQVVPEHNKKTKRDSTTTTTTASSSKLVQGTSSKVSRTTAATTTTSKDGSESSTVNDVPEDPLQHLFCDIVGPSQIQDNGESVNDKKPSATASVQRQADNNDDSNDNNNNNNDDDSLLAEIVGPNNNNKNKTKNKKKRKQYVCALCKGTGHNSSKCTYYSPNGIEQFKNLKSGEYVVGYEPALECGISTDVYLENSNNTTIDDDIPMDVVTYFHKCIQKILAYTLTMGYDEFVTTYFDMLDFYSTNGSEHAMRSIINSTNDPLAITYISKVHGSFHQYLLQDIEHG